MTTHSFAVRQSGNRPQEQLLFVQLSTCLQRARAHGLDHSLPDILCPWLSVSAQMSAACYASDTDLVGSSYRGTLLALVKACINIPVTRSRNHIPNCYHCSSYGQSNLLSLMLDNVTFDHLGPGVFHDCSA